MSVHVQFCGYRTDAKSRPIHWFMVLGDGLDFTPFSQLLVSRMGDPAHRATAITLYNVPAELRSPHEGDQTCQTLASPLGDLCRYPESVRYNWHQCSIGAGMQYGLVTVCMATILEQELCTVGGQADGPYVRLHTQRLLEAASDERPVR